ncbi:HEPN domain-containing protein [Kiritimatiella glycovorans]|uniref:HEPN domain protein n=1 Tax=Kiritimatiella glycovorans TaxID=1307763 RepID=A0A0G3EL57_9BACT|nr:HEPN domain-containing protein [Kiritimatiella glycovorans]AKJ65500.1 HEPN domain protein [Kiritimatiella glycovorans]
MKKTTQAWLDAALDDLKVMQQLEGRADLTHMLAFHAQQCVEKSYKALMEERAISFKKTHSIEQLTGLILDNKLMDVDEESVVPALLDQLYIDARYPGDLGLLPEGKPSTHKAEEFRAYARSVYDAVNRCLGA